MAVTRRGRIFLFSLPIFIIWVGMSGLSLQGHGKVLN